MAGFASSFGNSSSSNSGGSMSRGNSSSASGYALTPWQSSQLGSLYPQLASVGGMTPSMGGVGRNLGVGGPTAYPTITTAPIWDQGQIQSQVNLNRANNDAAAQGQMAQMRREIAGRGYGAYSPFATTLGQNMQAMNRAGNTETETNLRFNAAKENSAQILRQQMADVQRSGMLNNDLFQRDQLRVDQDIRRKGLGVNKYGIEWGAKMGALGQQGQHLQARPWSKSDSSNYSTAWNSGRSDSNQGSQNFTSGDDDFWNKSYR